MTRLIGVSPQNVITIKGDLEHMTMMNDGSLQKQIAKLLSPGPHALRRMRAQAKTIGLGCSVLHQAPA